MPSQFPSTFASAAASGNGGASEGGSNTRNSPWGDNGADWSRARTNGATQTFRRPSLATNSSHQRETAQSNTSNSASNTGVYVPPHVNAGHYGRNGISNESRYSKDQLLELFRAQAESGQVGKNLSDLFVGGWTPGGSNSTLNGGWGRRDEPKEIGTGPEICWDNEGSVKPLSLIDMSEEEKELFSSSVNSPLKPPSQNANKDSTPTNGVNGRKSSISQIQNSGGIPSPTTRLGMRRRDTSESLQSSNLLASPSDNNRLSRDETQGPAPPPSLLRRRTDLKDGTLGAGLGERLKDGGKQEGVLDIGSPFGSLKRTNTGPLSAGIASTSSPWSTGPQSAGFSPMGAFGNFSLGGISGQPTTPGEKKAAYGSLRGESRFKGLMSKESAEDIKTKFNDRNTVGGLEKLAEADSERSAPKWESRPERPGRPESRQFGDAEPTTGSAALGGDDPDPLLQKSNRLRNPERREPQNDIGFSSFGMSSDMAPFREVMQRREFSQQHTSQNPSHGNVQPNEPMSPTNTNPYQSPEGERAVPGVVDADDEYHNPHLPDLGISGNPSRSFIPSFEGVPGDRSQTSSAGQSRTFPNLSALGGFGGLGTTSSWSAAPGAVGTPSRVTPSFASGFGDSIFGGLGDLQSPNHAGLSGSGAFGGPGSSAFGSQGITARGSKMGSLFSTAMQDQMRGSESSKLDHALDDGDSYPSSSGRLQTNLALGPSNTSRDPDNTSRSGRGMLDDLFGGIESRNKGPQSLKTPFAANENQESISTSSQIPFSTASLSIGTPLTSAPSTSSAFVRAQDQDSNAISSQIPVTQQRQMVMPDRMRWIYRDPQGNVQGPWSGLEMHDWYKAGFFSPELQVKKLEDGEYEPLGQLIRRIGNSREPFLVPQIGIPHGSSSIPPGSNAPLSGNLPATSPGVQSGSAQPPFASSFPSFGTTLTAEQQNALERRKQEEQYLMARQKEHLAQQQVMIKHMHMQGGPHGMHPQQLHHHSSAHSLQSQPSYGSITSPTGYQPSPAQGPIQAPSGIPGFFEPQARNTGQPPLGVSLEALNAARENEMATTLERLNIGRMNQAPFVSQYNVNQAEDLTHQQQINAMLQDRARLQRDQDQFDLLQRGSVDESQAAAERLEQFHQLRAVRDAAYPQSFQADSIGQLPNSHRIDVEESSRQHLQNTSQPLRQEEEGETRRFRQDSEPFSLTEQVQKAASAKPAPTVQTQSPWAKVENDLPQPFPPPQSISPLPAPAAQRNRQNVADALAAESNSRSQTPSVETPSATIAPWARETNEGSKGPSLKEIQEAEARKTAQQDEIAAAARRAIVEQERQSQPSAPAPGLPSSANWASSASPATPSSSGPLAWNKPLAGKVPVATPATGAKKTLTQIQKEEESRKQRVAAAAAANTANTLATSNVPGGKRYADLAGKVTSPAPPAPGGAWTTVGAGGKMKTPTGPAALGPTPTPRAVSGGPTSNVATAVKPRPTTNSTRNPSAGGPLSGQPNASEEFQKWVKGALHKGLNTSINVDDFARNLLQLPPEPEILSEAVYANSQTLDGRRFAEEFIRRRKLADKGIIPDASVGGSNAFSTGSANESKSGGGWSEVAKKGPANGAKEESNAAFKVVAAKKKGKR